MSGSLGKAHFLNECTLTLSSDTKLHVHGSVMAFCSDDEVCVKKCAVNTNTEKLVLGLDIMHGSTPMEARPQQFSYIEQGDHVKDYKQVVVQYQDKECTIHVNL